MGWVGIPQKYKAQVFQVEVVQQGAVRAISVGNESFTRRGGRTDFLSLANDFCERR